MTYKEFRDALKQNSGPMNEWEMGELLSRHDAGIESESGCPDPVDHRMLSTIALLNVGVIV